MMKPSDPCRTDRLRVERRDEEIVLHLSGDFDKESTPQVHACCEAIGERVPVKRIVLDFREAGRVDTSAFACILSYIRKHKGEETEIVVTNLSDQATDLIRMLRLESIIRVL